MSTANERNKARSALSLALAKLDRRVLSSIRRTPEQGAADIADRLGEPVVDVRRSLYRLKRADKVVGEGNTRGTRYTATPAARTAK